MPRTEPERSSGVAEILPARWACAPLCHARSLAAVASPQAGAGRARSG